ncbi:MAG: VWA domain-containing protein [Candidatus Sumerlaeia bacterium]|nr:VWA domain-containing protein [Candidatus Sumerlaeia bacterium]
MEWRFLHPWFLLLLLLPLLILVRNLRSQHQRRAVVVYSDLSVLDHVRPSWKMRLMPILPFLRFLALSLLVVALARPQYGRSELLQSALGIDISMVLDISETMDINDYRPTRLEVAKNVMREFVEARTNDRINVIIFGTSPYVLVPPTFDKPTIVNFINIISGAAFAQQDRRTAIGMGLALGVDQLKDSEAPSRVAIVLTDGENNAGDITPIQAAEAAKALGVRVYTIGLLASSSTSSLFNPNPTDINFNRGELEKMAQITGGKFFMARDSEALRQIYEEIDKLEKVEIEAQEVENYAERFSYFLIPSLLLFGLDILLRFLVFRRIP